MRYSFKDSGIILKKKKLMGDHFLVTIFTRDNGKISLFSFGSRKITSKRISHLQTGNLVSFSACRNREYVNLEETELIDGFCRYALHPSKADFMYLVFFILDKILPEAQNEVDIYLETLSYLQFLESSDIDDVIANNFHEYAKSILCKSGFCSQEIVQSPTFNPIEYIEEVLQRKVKRIFV